MLPWEYYSTLLTATITYQYFTMLVYTKHSCILISACHEVSLKSCAASLFNYTNCCCLNGIHVHLLYAIHIYYCHYKTFNVYYILFYRILIV